ncbi:MAG: SRPBCC family protein [Burkholderiaceae bacterium]|nr:SRPBCC family protein [Burkholderiaceae bacterium]
MHVERSFSIAAPIDRVWRFITTPDEVGPCMPGCQKVEIVGPGKYQAIIGVKVGPIKTAFTFDVETVEERAPEFALFAIRGNEGGNASKVTAENTLRLRSLGEAGTEVSYASRISIIGRLGKFAGGVMQKVAESQSDQFIAAVRERLEPVAAPAAAEAAAAETAAAEAAPVDGGLLARLLRWLTGLPGLFRRI